MEKIDEVVKKIESCISSQFDYGIENVDTKEMSAVADIFKDLVMAQYYCTVKEAMENADTSNYSQPRDMDYPRKMYYTEPKLSTTKTMMMPKERYKDMREGMSGEMRKTYVESKMIHGSDSDEMESLEDFLNTLDMDMTELYPNMTSAEKQMTKNKLQLMMNKIA